MLGRDRPLEAARRWRSRRSRSPLAELPELRVRLAGEPIGADGERLLDGLRERPTTPDLRGRVTFAGRGRATRRAALAGRPACSTARSASRYGMVVAEALAAGAAGGGPGRVRAGGDRGPRVRPAVPARRRRRGRARAGGGARRARPSGARWARPRRRGRSGSSTCARCGAMRLLAASLARRRGAAPARGAARGPAPGTELALVTVLHDSESELARPARVGRAAPAGRPASWWSTRARATAARSVARGWRDGRAEVVELGENVGFGRGANAGLALVERAGDGAAEPGRRAARRLARRGRARGAARARAAARPARAAPRRLARGQRPARARLRPACSRTRCVPGARAPAPARGRRRAVALRAAPPGRLGGRLLPRGPHGDAAPARARSTSASSSTPRTSTSACAPPTRGSRPGSGPPRACSTAARTPPRGRSAASRSSCWPAAAARWCASGAGRAAPAADDLLQLLHVRRPPAAEAAGGRPAGRERRQLAALLRALARGAAGERRRSPSTPAPPSARDRRRRAAWRARWRGGCPRCDPTATG